MPVGSKDFKQAGDPDAKIQDVKGVVLVGGKSLRYGRNKALVEVGGVPLIECVLNVMDSVFDQVILITNSPDLYRYLDRPMYGDIIKGMGPLGGLLTGLTAIFPQHGFFVACDMPTLNARLIRHIALSKDRFDVVVPLIKGHLEALHALYGPACLAPIRGMLLQGRLQLIRLFQHVSVRYVEEAELRRFDPRLESFFNINSPAEMERFVETRRPSAP